MLIGRQSEAESRKKTARQSDNDVMASLAESGLSPVERRLKQLERLLLTTGAEDGASSAMVNVSVDTLLDGLLVLYDECFNSALRREKTVSDFLELSEYTGTL